jgi:hypothetical protein
MLVILSQSHNRLSRKQSSDSVVVQWLCPIPSSSLTRQSTSATDQTLVESKRDKRRMVRPSKHVHKLVECVPAKSSASVCCSRNVVEQKELSKESRA